jgi:beta-glucanase (GH16 family)
VPFRRSAPCAAPLQPGGRRDRADIVSAIGVTLFAISMVSCQLAASVPGLPACGTGAAAATGPPCVAAASGASDLARQQPLDATAGPVGHETAPVEPDEQATLEGGDAVDGAFGPAPGLRVAGSIAGGSAGAPLDPALDRSTASPSSDGARLVWSDEFNGPAGPGVDPSRWEQAVGAPTTNGRVEYLTGGTQNVALDGQGDLVITARREEHGGRAYTSGRIESYASFTTGYLEFRAKVPTWPGTMPGLWTYGASGYGPQSGFSEIDALEIQTGAALDPTSVRQTIHGAMPDGSTIWQLGWSHDRADFAPGRPGDAWHTYGVYVNPRDRSVTFYVDGRARTTYRDGEQPAGGAWSYGTEPQKVVIEIEMGGYSGPLTTDRSSDALEVDYVRLYDEPPQ